MLERELNILSWETNTKLLSEEVIKVLCNQKKKKKEKYQAVNKKKNSSQCFVMRVDVAFKIFNLPLFFPPS